MPMATTANSLDRPRALCLRNGSPLFSSLWFLEGEVEFLVDGDALGVDPLQQLGDGVRHLLGRQVELLGAELLQQVFGRHGLPLQVPPDGVFRDAIAADRATAALDSLLMSVHRCARTATRGPDSNSDPENGWTFSPSTFNMTKQETKTRK